MANGTPGNGNGRFSEKTWVPVSLVITVITICGGTIWWTASSTSSTAKDVAHLVTKVGELSAWKDKHAELPGHRSAGKDIEYLQRQVQELRGERDSLRDKLSNYRAEVEGFRVQCYEQHGDVEHLRDRVVALESKR